MAEPIRFTMNTAVSSPWQMANFHAQPFQLSISVTVTGTINFSVEYTYERFWSMPDPSSWQPDSPSPTVLQSPLTNSTTSGETTFDNPIVGWRVTVNSVSGGSIVVDAVQAGIRG